MLAAYTQILPVTLLPSQTLTLSLETVLTTLPVMNAKVLVRNLEPAVSLNVAVNAYLMVAGAPLQFNGTFAMAIVNAGVAPNSFLSWSPLVNVLEGQVVRHDLVLQNLDALNNAKVVVHVNGTYDSLTPVPRPTITVPPLTP